MSELTPYPHLVLRRDARNADMRAPQSERLATFRKELMSLIHGRNP
jgi:hypothetical protein